MTVNATAKASEISDREFVGIQSLLFKKSGISLGDSKKSLVVSRLCKRLREYELTSYTEYLELLTRPDSHDELQMALDLLTTNETYFFREPNHFQFLKSHAEKSRYGGSDNYRVWSAACSFGQEPYSVAMVLEDSLGNRPWEILASDISTRVLDTARMAQYPIAQADNIPREYLSRYCLKGVGSQQGTFVVDKNLQKKIRFFHGNLNEELPRIGSFDVIFLRNVMIYFEPATKRQVVSRLQSLLKKGGYLLIGHSETLNGINEELKMVSPSIFVKP